MLTSWKNSYEPLRLLLKCQHVKHPLAWFIELRLYPRRCKESGTSVKKEKMKSNASSLIWSMKGIGHPKKHKEKCES